MKSFISVIATVVALVFASGCSTVQKNVPYEVEKTTVKTLVVLDRANTSMDHRLYYALRESAERQKLALKYEFDIANPYKANIIDMSLSSRKMQLAIYSDVNASVNELLSIKAQKPKNISMSDALFDYIKNNPKSRLSNAYGVATKMMKDYNLMLIEPTGETALHPIYYDENIVGADGFGANVLDILDSTYQLMLIDNAIKNKIPIIGMCHGAQIGYAYMGGDLEKYYKYDAEVKNVAEHKKMIMARNNPYGGGIEVWNLQDYIMTRLWSNHTIHFENIKYPLAPYMKKALNIQKSKDVFINKEFAQSLAMKLPLPKGVETHTMHPLSNLKDDMSSVVKEFNTLPSNDSYVTAQTTENFLSVFKDELHVVDFYKYKTLYGTQYHPQYVYDDYDTHLVFDFYTQMIKKSQN